MIGQLVSHDVLLGRWRLSLDLFGRVFCDDVGAESGSVISELGGFPVKESRFRREMEKLRNLQQRDLTLEVERDRTSLIAGVMKQLNTQYNRRTNTSGPALCVHRVKVTFKDEPGEGSGVARSFYTAFAQAVLSSEKLPSLEGVTVGGKSLQYSKRFVVLCVKKYATCLCNVVTQYFRSDLFCSFLPFSQSGYKLLVVLISSCIIVRP